MKCTLNETCSVGASSSRHMPRCSARNKPCTHARMHQTPSSHSTSQATSVVKIHHWSLKYNWTRSFLEVKVKFSALDLLRAHWTAHVQAIGAKQQVLGGLTGRSSDCLAVQGQCLAESSVTSTGMVPCASSETAQIVDLTRALFTQ